MLSVRQDRRHSEHGSIICENGVLRLRVIRPGSSLGLVIEARNMHEQWILLASTPPAGSADYLDDAGVAQEMRFYAYDPLLTDGQTHGIVMYGNLGEARVTFTSTLTDASTWTQHLLEIHDITPAPCRQLVQSWQLAPSFSCAEIAWPARVRQQRTLIETPAAFQQVGAFFAALVPNIEEGDCSLLGVQSQVHGQASLSYGIIDNDQAPLIPPRNMKLAYALCLDARALPQRGFQEIVRLSGSQEALAIADYTTGAPSADQLPALPSVPDTADWIPFMYEGSPATIAAGVQYLLSLVAEGDWHFLEDALCWLDRLCFHQRVFELPGGDPLGSIGAGDGWQTTALWMPSLLLQAYRLTGILEYAYRAKAALSAMSPADRSCVLQQLSPVFGDIYVHLEYQNAFALGPVEIHSVIYGAGEIALELESPAKSTPLTLIVAGMGEPCTVFVNGESLGILPPAQLQAGIPLP